MYTAMATRKGRDTRLVVGPSVHNANPKSPYLIRAIIFKAILKNRSISSWRSLSRLCTDLKYLFGYFKLSA